MTLPPRRRQHARRIQVKAARRYPRGGIGQKLHQRHQRLPDHILQIAHRSHRPQRKGASANGPANVITVACARKLACFLWAAATAA